MEHIKSIKPNYTYPQIGSYTVTLYASNFWGCSDTTEVEVEITDLPIADFTVSNSYGCAPLNVSFTNTSYAPYSSYEWNLNGQAYSRNTPEQSFIQGDSIVLYDAQLVVSNICGQSELVKILRHYLYLK